MRVAVAVEGDVTTRAAQSLSAHPDVEVVLLSPATSSQFQVVDTPAGCAAVFGTVHAARVASEVGLPAVVTNNGDPGPGLHWASLEGLALALSAEMEEAQTVAVAVPGDAGGEDTIVFPSPIDGRSAYQKAVGPRSVYVAGTEGPLAAALAIGRDRHRVILDDHHFMQAIALAAAVGILMEDPITVPMPVWERSGLYLRTAAEMGLVIGERTAA